MNKILAEVKNPAVTFYDKPITTKEKVDADYVATEGEEIITTEDGTRMVVRQTPDKRYALKTYTDGILL